MTSREQSGEMVMPPSEGGVTQRVAAAVDRVVGWLARHWLAVFNLVVALFVALSFAAPVLMHLGANGKCSACTTAGRVIYLVYRPLCHQLPERSYFLYGPRATYSLGELEAMGAVPAGLNILQRELLRFPGSPDVGYKVAFCERDIAIFGAIVLGGLAFGLARKLLHRTGRQIPKLPVWAYLLALVPMIIDGGTQLVGLRESTWLLRTLTGGLFGLVTVWLAYPYIQEAMDDAAHAGESKGSGVA